MVFVTYRPIIPFRIIGDATDDYLRGLADTGADHSLLPRSIADRIGAEIDERTRWTVGGFAGQTARAVMGHVRMEITDGSATHQWSAQVGFVDYDDPEKESIALLGHLGFLQFFNAQFRGKDHVVILEPNGTFPANR